MASSKQQQQQQAREKAKELLQDAGQKLSAQEARKISDKANIPVQQVIRIAQNNNSIDIKVPQAVAQKLSTPGASAGTAPGRTPGNVPTGQTGVSPAAPARGNAQATGQPGGPSGSQATASEKEDEPGKTKVDAFAGGASPDYQNLIDGYNAQLDQYRTRVDEVTNQLRDAVKAKGDVEGKISSVQSQLDALTAEKNNAQKTSEAAVKAEDEKTERRIRDEQLARQLGTLRGGYKTGSFTTESGRGTLAGSPAGGASASSGRSSGLLEKAYKEISPTESVLDKSGRLSPLLEGRTIASADRTRARERALATGTSVRQYYARRFG